MGGDVQDGAGYVVDMTQSGVDATGEHDNESPIPDMLNPGRHTHDPYFVAFGVVELPGQATQVLDNALKK
jgi:hypothetical protein